jgi:hypothetical protein
LRFRPAAPRLLAKSPIPSAVAASGSSSKALLDGVGTACPRYSKPTVPGTRPSPPVRLRGQWDRAVEVRFCAVKSRAVSNRNCVAAMRGGEQRNENDQSVTQVVPGDSRRELDSVGVDGRVFERKTKPAKRAIGASQIAGQPGGPRSWHRWLETEWSAVPRPKSGRPAGDQRRSWQQCPKNRPAGVRASVVAKKRVTTVEPRDAGR